MSNKQAVIYVELFAYLKNMLYVYNHTARRLKRAFICPNLALALPIIFKLLNSLSIIRSTPPTSYGLITDGVFARTRIR